MQMFILMTKTIFMKYLPPVRPKLVKKIENVQNLFKFGRIDISNMQISILMSKMIFIKYLPPVRPKYVQNQKCLEIIEI